MWCGKKEWINLAALLISWGVLGFFAFDYYSTLWQYNRQAMLIFLGVLAVSMGLFTGARVVDAPRGLARVHVPLSVITAALAFLSAPALNPCSNGCDDTPIGVAWLAGLMGFIFLRRGNLGWKYWLYLWGVIHVFSMARRPRIFGIGAGKR